MNEPSSDLGIAPAWRSYLVGAAVTGPAFAAWMFSSIFILPGIEELWAKARLSGTRPQWLVDVANSFINEGRLILAAVVLIFVILEMAIPGWPRRRGWVILTIACLFNAFVLVDLLATSTAAVLVARALAKS